MNLAAPHRLRTAPVVVQDGPERLIQVFAVAQEGFAQDTLLDRADLPKRAVAPSVGHGSPRLQPVRTDHVEREVDDHLRAIEERARAPERGADREAPLGGGEARFQLTELEDS